MARVHLAVAQGVRGFHKLLVIKQISATHGEDPEFVSMFLDEARLAARLQHANVVQTHEVGEEDGRHFIVMEYLEGQALNHVLKRLWHRDALPLGLHLRALADVLRGLHHAHELADYDGSPLGVVHRDATPGNVFVTYDGVVKVVDFGIAKTRDASTKTAVGVIKGKFAYMAPEQARGAEIDRRADVFSVGVMLWEAATRTRMWKALSHDAILLRLVQGDIPEPTSAGAELPAALDAIIRKATAPDPDARFPTAAAFAAELDRYLDDRGERADLRDLGKLVDAHFAGERAALNALVQAKIGIPSTPLSAPAPDSVESDPVMPVPTYTTTLVSQDLRRPRGAPTVLVWCAVAAAAAVLTWNGERPGAPAPGALASTTAPATRSETRVATAKLHVLTTPPDATIFVDGTRIAADLAELRADDAQHLLWVEAPGYEARSEGFTLMRDRDLEIVLTKVPEPTRRHDDAEAEARNASPAAPAKSGRSSRRLDPVNPYKQ
jgi:serine/threonine-protein kinase